MTTAKSADNSQTPEKHFNILNLNGQALAAFKNTYVLSKIEEYAYNYTQEKGYKVSDRVLENQRIDIKDIFDMTVGISTSTLLAVGLSMMSPEYRNSDAPRYNSKEFMVF